MTPSESLLAKIIDHLEILEEVTKKLSVRMDELEAEYDDRNTTVDDTLHELQNLVASLNDICESNYISLSDRVEAVEDQIDELADDEEG